MNSRDEVPQALLPFLISDRIEEDTEVLGITQAAERLQETPETIERWIRDKQLLAWENDAGVRIPAEQIVGPHCLISGIERVLEMMTSSRAAWDFLVRESAFFTHGPRRPIDALKEGQVEDVISAIHADYEAFS